MSSGVLHEQRQLYKMSRWKLSGRKRTVRLQNLSYGPNHICRGIDRWCCLWWVTLILSSVSYVAIWQFFEVNFDRFDISKARTQSHARETQILKQKIETKIETENGNMKSAIGLSTIFLIVQGGNMFPESSLWHINLRWLAPLYCRKLVWQINDICKYVDIFLYRYKYLNKKWVY